MLGPPRGGKAQTRAWTVNCYFHESAGGETKQIVLSVKAGHVQASHVRDLAGVLNREQAQIGALISLEEPTRPMREEAASAGIYESPWGRHPRLQLLTVRELLEGKKLDCPQAEGVNVTYKRAPRARRRKGEQISMTLSAKANEPSE